MLFRKASLFNLFGLTENDNIKVNLIVNGYHVLINVGYLNYEPIIIGIFTVFIMEIVCRNS